MNDTDRGVDGPVRPVVLLHGLGRTRLAMLPLVRTLREAGYHPINMGYFAAWRRVPTIATKVAERIDELLVDHPPPTPVHFVTHSLGGLLARFYLGRLGAQRRPGTRLVQLAPPNQGALIAERISQTPIVGKIAGNPLRELGLAADGGPRLDLPELDGVDIGVVAGGKGEDKGFGPWFDEDSDGIVRVKETYLPEARDWILVRQLHTFIMNGLESRENVVHFLRTGRFLPGARRLVRDPEGHVCLAEAG